jgi:hypothetical protein
MRSTALLFDPPRRAPHPYDSIQQSTKNYVSIQQSTTDGLMNGHSSNTMTPYNNQQKGHVSSAAECTRSKNNVLDGRRQNHPEPNGLLPEGGGAKPSGGCGWDPP